MTETTSPSAAAGRDLRLDLLRGLCVARMLLVHLGWSFGFFRWPFGLVTAAEGFFLLSGITLGRVGRRYAATGRATAFGWRLLRRAGWLWFANTLLVLALRQLEGTCACPTGLFAMVFGDLSPVHQVLSFDQPSVLHVLPRYVVFLAVTPLVLAAIRAGAGVWVGALSALLWMHTRLPYHAFKLPYFETGDSNFPVAAWQLLFVGGILIGHRRWGEDDRGRVSATAAAAGALLALGFALLDHYGIPLLGAARPGRTDYWFGRPLLGPYRLLNLASLGLFCWWATDRWLAAIRRWAGWLLEPLGQRALAAFLLHTPVVWAVSCLPARLHGAWGQPLVACAGLLAVLVLVRRPAIQRLLSPV